MAQFAASDRTDDLPEAMAELAGEFHALAERDRLQLLLELANDLPDLPERYAGRLDEMEKVDECQSPVFLAVEVDPEGERAVHLHLSAPPEAPTTRGFAGILHESLDGLPAEEVLAVPDEAPFRFGLAEAVSPLRMRGMVGMLGRIKRQVRAHISIDERQ
ncbi:SufE family protein [Ornithinimicrobium cryptoxanthini]|uniref:SufE family protein n=1 Tax=Ornithinimicrobium cryptoxanthini TaxID=2934161 RepID=A0ABY4YNR6_9MICO|nr:SufE family protein [Ornithinimicrobium cryptoxanthini]USQ77900.1 SufE family protein [Ornithinimicrobium cryptoxanthini]